MKCDRNCYVSREREARGTEALVFFCMFPGVFLKALPTNVKTFIKYNIQCAKLRVHPALSVHISTARCTILGGVHPVCARFLSHFYIAIYWEGA